MQQPLDGVSSRLEYADQGTVVGRIFIIAQLINKPLWSMSKQSSDKQRENQDRISRRSTLAATGTGVIVGLTGVGESTIGPAGAQQDSDEEVSLAFFAGTEPKAEQTLREFSSSSPRVTVENPPPEAAEVVLLDADTEQEIYSSVDEIGEDPVPLNSIGSIQFSLENDRQAAKEDFEDQLDQSVVLELNEQLDAEADIDDLDGLFRLNLEDARKVEFVEGEDVELVLFDTDEERIEGSGEIITIQEAPEPMLIEADSDAGFNYPYYLYSPNKSSADDATPLLVEPNNTGTSTDDFEQHRQRARETAERGVGRAVADELNSPLLVPVFPRPRSDPVDFTHYVHALDDTTMAIEDGPLERVDLQLLSMVEDARDRLRTDDYPIDESGIMLNGFSASGTFVDRFTVLHPDEVISVTAGGVNGMPLLPTDEFDEQELPYHVGTADVEDLTGEEVDRDALDSTNQFLYMGAEDENDTIPFGDAWTDDELRQLALDVYGDNMVYERFPTSQKIYEDVEVEAQFRVYSGVGHTPRPATTDIIEFHRRSIAGEGVSDLGETIVPDPHIDLSATTASVGEEIELDASQSTGAVDADVVAYQWDFGDGSEATGETTTVAYSEQGLFTVVLTIVTERGNEYQTTAEIDIGGSSMFNVDLGDMEQEVTTGQQVDIEINVENTGAVSDTQDIVLNINGEQVETLEEVELDPGEQLNDSFTYEVGEEDAPEITAIVETDDDEARTEVGVLDTEGEDGDGTGSQDDDEETTAEDDTTESRDTDDPESEGEDPAADDEGPGFGVGGAVASLGGAAYILKRRLSGENTNE